jgi:hypothetical protein
VRDVNGVLTVDAPWLVKLSEAVRANCVSVLKAMSANSPPALAPETKTQFALIGVLTSPMFSDKGFAELHRLLFVGSVPLLHAEASASRASPIVANAPRLRGASMALLLELGDPRPTIQTGVS